MLAQTTEPTQFKNEMQAFIEGCLGTSSIYKRVAAWVSSDARQSIIDECIKSINCCARMDELALRANAGMDITSDTGDVKFVVAMLKEAMSITSSARNNIEQVMNYPGLQGPYKVLATAIHKHTNEATLMLRNVFKEMGIVNQAIQCCSFVHGLCDRNGRLISPMRCHTKPPAIIDSLMVPLPVRMTCDFWHLALPGVRMPRLDGAQL